MTLANHVGKRRSGLVAEVLTTILAKPVSDEVENVLGVSRGSGFASVALRASGPGRGLFRVQKLMTRPQWQRRT